MKTNSNAEFWFLWQTDSLLAKLLRVLEQSPHCFTTWYFLVPVWIVSTRISSTLEGSWLPPVCEVVLRHGRSPVEQRALSHSMLRRKSSPPNSLPQITTHTQYARWLADLLPRISQPVTLLISDVPFTVYNPCIVALVCTSAWSSATVWLIYRSDALLPAGRLKLIVLLKASCSHPARAASVCREIAFFVPAASFCGSC